MNRANNLFPRIRTFLVIELKNASENKCSKKRPVSLITVQEDQNDNKCQYNNHCVPRRFNTNGASTLRLKIPKLSLIHNYCIKWHESNRKHKNWVEILLQQRVFFLPIEIAIKWMIGWYVLRFISRFQWIKKKTFLNRVDG